MTDDRHDADEQLSAYLAGELDADAADAFERRMAADPALRVRADALADALMRLHGADQADEPAGFAHRLQQRLAQERRVVHLDDRRPVRQRPSRWWAGAAAAAVVAVGALVATGTLRSLGSGDDAATTAGMESADQAGGEGGATGVPAVPAIVDGDVALADEDALRDHFGDAPEAATVLGMSAAEAKGVAEDYGSIVRAQTGELVGMRPSSSALSDGDDSTDATVESSTESAGAAAPPAQARSATEAGPGDCLDAISEGAPGPVVPVRVETLRYRGEPAVAYVVVTSGPEGDRMSRTEVWVVEPDDCSTITFAEL